METTAQVRYPILLLVFVISFHIPDARQSVVNCFEQGSKQPPHCFSLRKFIEPNLVLMRNDLCSLPSNGSCCCGVWSSGGNVCCSV